MLRLHLRKAVELKGLEPDDRMFAAGFHRPHKRAMIGFKQKQQNMQGLE
jgi:hypothetical protein